MQLFGIISVLMCLITLISVNSASPLDRNVKGSIPSDSLTWRLSDFIKGQARFPIRSFSTEDYSEDEEDSKPVSDTQTSRKPEPSKPESSKPVSKNQSQIKSKIIRPTHNTLESDLHSTLIELLQISKRKNLAGKLRW